MTDILVLYYSRTGATEALAREVCRGIDSVAGAASRLRTVPAVSTVTEAADDEIPADGPPFATRDDLQECAGLVLGSPTRFGNMAAGLKYFLDGTVSDWLAGTLIGIAVYAGLLALMGAPELDALRRRLPGRTRTTAE